MSEEQYATFGGGCFWCLEAIFQRQADVRSVTSGYQGGKRKNPTYEQVCSGATGHAEVIRVAYDPRAISYERLLDLFWRAHDPTQLNRQGNDIGTQYRSIIFYHTEDQKKAALESKQALEASGTYRAPIVTQIESATEFYPAEEYHQNYYRDHSNAPYCQLIIKPKMEKLGLEH